MEATRMHECRFSSMGTTAHVVVVGGGPGLLAVARHRLGELEGRWSRFRTDSEVSRHNAALSSGDEPPSVSAETRLLFERAATGFNLTAGRFDPYRLDAVVAAGYQHSRSPDDDTTGPSHPAHPAAPLRGFDPGGIGKGLAADIVSAELIEAGASGALVSIGGDLRVRGEAPDGTAWRIDIEDPRDGSVLTTVELRDGAVATSSQVKRRWTNPDGTTAHHLVDPATGTSSTSAVLSATVIAGEAWQAEVLTKVAFLDAFATSALDDDGGLELIESLKASAIVVTPGLIASTSRWASFEVSVRSPEVVR